MNLFNILAVCLALFIHSALAENDVVIESSNSTSASNSSSSSSSSNATVLANSNSTTAANNSSSSTESANSTTSTGSNTTVVSAPANITAAPENSTVSSNTSTSNSNATSTPGNGTSADNGTATESGGDDSSSSSASPPSNQYTSNASSADMTMFGVSAECAALIRTCYSTNASTEFQQLLYCEAFQKTEDCLQTNTTGENATEETCSLTERTRVQVFSCGPSNENLDVAAPCKARLTQCAVGELSSSEMDTVADDDLFTEKMCATLVTNMCLQNWKEGAVCTEAEVSTIHEDAPCSAISLLSSAFLVAAMFLITKAM